MMNQINLFFVYKYLLVSPNRTTKTSVHFPNMEDIPKALRDVCTVSWNGGPDPLTFNCATLGFEFN